MDDDRITQQQLENYVKFPFEKGKSSASGLGNAAFPPVALTLRLIALSGLGFHQLHLRRLFSSLAFVGFYQSICSPSLMFVVQNLCPKCEG